MSYEREGVTYERVKPRHGSDPVYVVRLHGRLVGVIYSCLTVKRYKTRGPKYHEGFAGVWLNGVEHCTRARRNLAGWMIDHPDGAIWTSHRQ